MEEIKIEYMKLSKKDLEELEFTGDWDKDKVRFSNAWRRNQGIYSLDNWDVIDNGEEEEYI